MGFGLSNTLADVNDEFGKIKIRPGAMELLREIKNHGHELILWTTKKRGLISLFENNEKYFFKMFSKTYYKGDVDVLENIPGNSMHQFKNINKIGADCLIESKETYKKYAECLQLGDKYHTVDKYRECLYKQPTSWQIRVVDENALEKYHQRMLKSEDWIYSVLNFIEKLEKSTATTL